MEIFKETWRKSLDRRGAHNTCYRKPRHLIETHHQTISFIVNFSSDSDANFFNASAFGRLERSSNSQKSPKIPPQIDIVSDFNPCIWDPKSRFRRFWRFLYGQNFFKFKNLAKIFEHTCNSISKESNNSHLYFKLTRFSIMFHNSSTGKLVSSPAGSTG